MMRPAPSLNWYDPGVSGIVEGTGRCTPPLSRPTWRSPCGMPRAVQDVMLLQPAWNSGTHIGSVADNPAVGDQAVPAGHERNPTPSGAPQHAETPGSAPGPLHLGHCRPTRRV